MTQWTSLTDDLIVADMRDDNSPLPAGSRPELEAALMRILVDPRRLNDHIRHLQKQLEMRFRHRTLLDEATSEAVLHKGLTALADTELAHLVLNPIALLALAEEIEERQPPSWAEAHREAGLELLREHGRTIPPLQEVLARRTPHTDWQGVGVLESSD